MVSTGSQNAPHLLLTWDLYGLGACRRLSSPWEWRPHAASQASQLPARCHKIILTLEAAPRLVQQDSRENNAAARPAMPPMEESHPAILRQVRKRSRLRNTPNPESVLGATGVPDPLTQGPWPPLFPLQGYRRPQHPHKSVGTAPRSPLPTRQVAHCNVSSPLG